ncbi:MAG: hypothetical protein ACFNUN_03790 [Aggregatibacter sp.]|jgi:hypothetical protein|uniref:hypothetical protein n=1 Tax=Aggregatibacter sp. TaxID=1872413 RepID=UPI0036205817
MRLLFIGFFGLILSSVASANISNGTIFSCDLENGKRLTFSSNDKSVEYRVDNIGVKDPEIYLLLDKKDIKVESNKSEDVNLYNFFVPNNGYTYEVIFSEFKNVYIGIIGAGVKVYKGDSLLNKYQCQKFKDISSHINNAKKNEVNSVELSPGTYKIGVDAPAGEYKLHTDDNKYGGFYRVFLDSSNKLSSIVTGDSFENVTYVTVTNGQYLELNRCVAVKIK